MELTELQVLLIAQWQTAEDQLRMYKNLEAQLRQQIVDELFVFDTDESTDTVHLNRGYKLVARISLNYSLKGPGEVVADAVSELPSELVRWKPELSVSVYRTLSEEQKAHLNSVLEIKPARPTLEIREPKQ